MSTIVYVVSTSTGVQFYSCAVSDIVGAIGAVLNISPEKAKAAWEGRVEPRSKVARFQQGTRSVTITRLCLRSITQHSVNRAMNSL